MPFCVSCLCPHNLHNATAVDVPIFFVDAAHLLCVSVCVHAFLLRKCVVQINFQTGDVGVSWLAIPWSWAIFPCLSPIFSCLLISKSYLLYVSFGSKEGIYPCIIFFLKFSLFFVFYIHIPIFCATHNAHIFRDSNSFLGNLQKRCDWAQLHQWMRSVLTDNTNFIAFDSQKYVIAATNADEVQRLANCRGSHSLGIPASLGNSLPPNL